MNTDIENKKADMIEKLQYLNHFEIQLVNLSIDALELPKWIGQPLYYLLFAFGKLYGMTKQAIPERARVFLRRVYRWVKSIPARWVLWQAGK